LFPLIFASASVHSKTKHTPRLSRQWVSTAESHTHCDCFGREYLQKIQQIAIHILYVLQCFVNKAWLSRGFKSGDRACQSTGSLWPIHLFPKPLVQCTCTALVECGGAPSCMNHLMRVDFHVLRNSLRIFVIHTYDVLVAYRSYRAAETVTVGSTTNVRSC
jgi:hypothetical protein